MAKYLLSRLWQAAVVMVLVSMITFLLVNLAPGGPSGAMAMDLPAEQRVAIMHSLGLDRPLQVRYVLWVGALLRGDLGRSFSDPRPVWDVISDKMLNTMLLGGAARGISVTVGITLGVLGASRPYSLVDYISSFLSLIGQAIPAFWLGIVLIILLSVQWQLLPSSGMATVGAEFSIADRLAHILLPTMVLSTAVLPYVVRLTRSAMMEALRKDFVRTAKAKGVSEWAVVYRHALRNALFPVVTVIGLSIPRLASGSVITEQVFAWPGMGRLAFQAAVQRDYPVIMGLTVLVSAIVVVTNLAVDVSYVYLDPRVRYA
jgi:peptide/nickel transport system permease protein